MCTAARPPAPPPVPEPPAPPAPSQDAVQYRAKQQNVALRSRGLSGTRLTGPLGVQDPGALGKTLLGQ